MCQIPAVLLRNSLCSLYVAKFYSPEVWCYEAGIHLYVVRNDLRSWTSCQDISFKAGGRMRWNRKPLQWCLKRCIDIFLKCPFKTLLGLFQLLKWIARLGSSHYIVCIFFYLTQCRGHISMFSSNSFFRNSFYIYFMSPYLVYSIFYFCKKIFIN